MWSLNFKNLSLLNDKCQLSCNEIWIVLIVEGIGINQDEFDKRQIHGAFEATHREDCSKWLGILPAQWGVTGAEKAVKNRHNTCKYCRQLNTSDFENRCGTSLKKVDRIALYVEDLSLPI